MTSFGDTGERPAIQAIRGVIRGNGGPDDDASLLGVPGGELAVCTDSVSFERHKPRGMTFEQFGWTAAAVNLSDLAAMGARPVGVMASLMLPEDTEMSDVEAVMSGFDQCAEFAGTEVIGGDTKPGPGVVSGTALGLMEGRRPMTRKGASAGDLIAVTGPLGGPAAGFDALRRGYDSPDCVFSLYVPIPRVEEGIALSGTGKVTSCMDLSDGLSTALNTLCRINGLGAAVEWDLIPRADGVDETVEALGLSDEETVMDWGGEYELLFTFNREDLEAIRATDVDFCIIGVMTDDGGVMLRRDGEYRVVGDGTY